MNRELARKVADAVLYEGYMLYPYRPSAIKNRQRWTFGILYPAAYPEVAQGTERSAMHSECLLKITGEANLQVQVRFLHLVTGQVEQSVGGRMHLVSSLTVDGKVIESWDEGVERTVEFQVTPTVGRPHCTTFTFPGNSETEPLRDSSGEVVGAINRIQQEVAGAISVSSEETAAGVLKLSIDVMNKSLLPPDTNDRDSAMLVSLLSAHTILTVTGGEFVSLLSPPEDLHESVSACRNIGNFPVLVGAEPERDMLLCSPIVLYDYPQVAPESAGDFFDATEMDEVLTLRVITLTDQEKDEMRLADEHARNLLQRTEQTAREQLMKTHGTIRTMRRVSEGR